MAETRARGGERRPPLIGALEWKIAWRHIRAGSQRPRWLRVVNAVSVYLFAVGLGLAFYASTLGPEALDGEQLFSAVVVTPSQRYVGMFAGLSIGLGAALGVFALLARYFNVLATIITISVMAGCMQLVTVLSLMSGLEVDLRDKILNQKAHIRVSGVDGNRFTDYEQLADRLAELPGVTGASPYLEDEVMVRSGLNRQGAVLLGVQPDRLETVSNLREILEDGDFDSLTHPETIPEFDPFAIGSDDTPWRLRHLDPELTAAEQGTNPAPHAIAEELKLGHAIDDTAAETPPAGDEGRIAEPAGPTAAIPGAARVAEPATGAAEGDWEDPAAVLGLPGAPPTVDPARRPEPRSTAAGGPSEPPDEDGTDWEDPETVLGLSPEIAAGGANGGGREPGASPPDAERDENDEGVVDPILIGRELAMELAVSVGARVQLITPVGRMTPAGRVPGQLATRVGGVFYSGMYEYDRKNVYLPLPVAQAFLRTGDRITGIEVKLADIEQLEEGRAAVQAVVDAQGRGDELVVETWEDLNRNLFSAMFLEKIAMFVALLFVILVASFGILASNLMSVLEKSKEIAIMKAMGAQDLLIRRVFVAEGLAMGLVGAASGIVMGLVLCWALDRFGFPLNENVYYIEKLPVVVNPLEVALVGVAALLIVWASSLYPAWVASRMRPAEGLRHAE